MASGKANYHEIVRGMRWHDRRRWAAAATLVRHGDPEDLGVDVMRDVLARRCSRHNQSAWMVHEAAAELMEDFGAEVSFDADADVLRTERDGVQVRPPSCAVRKGASAPWIRCADCRTLISTLERLLNDDGRQ